MTMTMLILMCDEFTELTDEMLYRRILASEENHLEIKLMNSDLEKLAYAGNAKYKDELEKLIVYPHPNKELAYPDYFKIVAKYSAYLIKISRYHSESYLYRAINHVIHRVEEILGYERESIKTLKSTWRVDYEERR